MVANMRTPIIAGNWKMNTTVAEALDLVRALRGRLEAVPSVERVVCPPFVSLASVSAELDGSTIAVGAQNLYWQEKGAFTGEISPLMLKPLCTYVIIGHSERRQYFDETNETVNQKAKAALKAGLKPIVCVGENLAQREAGQTNDFVSEQIKRGLDGLASTDALVVAYEPIWAIGTGRAATGAMAEDVCALIRQTLAGMFGASPASGVRIQYGGSVTIANVAEFMGQTDIDGALVGGASLKAEEFAKIVELTATVKQGR
jgi:triosephosphate isomerase